MRPSCTWKGTRYSPARIAGAASSPDAGHSPPVMASNPAIAIIARPSIVRQLLRVHAANDAVQSIHSKVHIPRRPEGHTDVREHDVALHVWGAPGDGDRRQRDDGCERARREPGLCKRG